MAPLKENSEAIDKIENNIQISTEESLLDSFFSLNKFSEGKDSLKQAFVDFLEFAKIELEKLIRFVPLYKVKSWEGIIVFCLEKTSNSLKYLVTILESWIIPFIDSLADEDELVENFKLFSNIHKMLLGMMTDLDSQSVIENHLPKDKWSFLCQKVKVHEKAKNENSKSKSRKLSRKRKVPEA